MVKLQLILARLLSIVAIIGFILGPILTPPASAVNAMPMASHADPMDMGAMAGMTAMKGSMECCPRHKAAVPACPKDCPWASLCAANCFPGALPVTSYVLIRSAIAEPITPPNDRQRDRMAEPPPPRPPRT